MLALPSARRLPPAAMPERWLQVCRVEITFELQPITFGATFSKAFSKLKAQSSNVSFH